MTASPALRLYALGGILLAALVACSRSDFGSPRFVLSLVVAGIAYLLAVRELLRTPTFPRPVVFACLALAALWRIPFLIAPPGEHNDIDRYIWDGRLQRLGYNPYRVIPADPAFAGVHTPQTRGLNNPELPTPYPAGAELFFRAVTAIRESIFAFKIAFLGCDFAIVLLLLNLLRRGGQGEHWVLVYAWHPLLGADVAGSHIDLLGALLVLMSAAALERRWRMTAAVAFGLAVAVKFLPIVLLPLYWRRLRIRDGLLAALIFGVTYVPFLEHGRIPIGSFGTFVQRFRFNGPVFATLERAASLPVATGLAALAGLATAVWLRSKAPAPGARASSPALASWADAWAWPMALSLACGPAVYPWYLLWLLPFLCSAGTLPLTVWTISILPVYLVWHLRALGHTWQVPAWLLLLEYGPVVATAAIVSLRRLARPVRPFSDRKPV